MDFTFNYFQKQDDIDLYLCNPDGSELYPIHGINRKVTLRFNDLSTLDFDAPFRITGSDGEDVDNSECYDLLETTRLVYATQIGWFRITNVSETDNGIEKYKAIQTESLQSVFRNKGFVTEERVYRLYNPEDPWDAGYNPAVEDSIPSIVGQLYKQLSIKIALSSTETEPSLPYEDWTITYISDDLKEIYRYFKENSTFGYDFMVNDVEDAFKCVVLFDFKNRAIKIKSIDNVTSLSDVCLSFDNFMTNIDVEENANDIVTVLSCSGNNVDIRNVNPSGTNYIVDFSYYMDKTTHKWMSKELIGAIEEWQDNVEQYKDTYKDYIEELSEIYSERTKVQEELQDIQVRLIDLSNYQAEVSAGMVNKDTNSYIKAAPVVEHVKLGKKSIYTDSPYYTTEFNDESIIDYYTTTPSRASGILWRCTGYSVASSISDIISNITENIYNNKSYKIPNYYFFDSSHTTYCELKYKVVKVEPVLDAFGEPLLDSVTGEPKTKEIYGCDGFVRHGIACFSDDKSYISNWISINQVAKAVREKCQHSYECDTGNEEYEHNSLECYDKKISKINSALESIAEKCNILKYIANSDKYVNNYQQLLRELNSYWIDGEYVDENISADDKTTDEQLLQLSETLLDNAKLELSKMCQPRYSFSVNVNSAIKQFEFKNQMINLELGRVISVEKKDGLWYYPALLELSFGLDDNEEFTMSFANALRLDDWGYTYADLISNSSSTSKRVSANWSELMKYVNDKDEIFDLISEPLNLTLRAGLSNATMQEFVIDDTGILGRKYDDESKTSFLNEQVRMINNLIMFTDDGWNTARAAFGKITLGDGSQHYGLIADAIVGKMLIGENLYITSKNDSITLNKDGITIKKGNLTTFSATTDGDVSIVGDFKGGSVNINDNFTVDPYGNVVMRGSINLAGNITWGNNANPFKELYARSYITKPSKEYSEYPTSSTTDWHTKLHSEDCYLSKSTDEGKTWSEPILFKADFSITTDNTLKFIYLRQASSSAPSTPTSTNGDSVPSGWSETPLEPTQTNPYVFISQGVITGNGVSSWSKPVLFNRYIGGLTNEQIQNAVTREHIFNILTTNGSIQGLFNVDTDNGNKLYINAEYLKAGTITAELIEGNSILAKHITTDAIKAEHILAGEIKAEHLAAGAITTEKITSETGKLVLGGWTVSQTKKMLYAKKSDGNYNIFVGNAANDSDVVLAINANTGIPENATSLAMLGAKLVIKSNGDIISKGLASFAGDIITDGKFIIRSSVKATNGSETSCLEIKGDSSITLKYDYYGIDWTGSSYKTSAGYLQFSDEYGDTVRITSKGVNISNDSFKNVLWETLIDSGYYTKILKDDGLTGYLRYQVANAAHYAEFTRGVLVGIYSDYNKLNLNDKSILNPS